MKNLKLIINICIAIAVVFTVCYSNDLNYDVVLYDDFFKSNNVNPTNDINVINPSEEISVEGYIVRLKNGDKCKYIDTFRTTYKGFKNGKYLYTCTIK